MQLVQTHDHLAEFPDQGFRRHFLFTRLGMVLRSIGHSLVENYDFVRDVVLSWEWYRRMLLHTQTHERFELHNCCVIDLQDQARQELRVIPFCTEGSPECRCERISHIGGYIEAL